MNLQEKVTVVPETRLIAWVQWQKKLTKDTGNSGQVMGISYVSILIVGAGYIHFLNPSNYIKIDASYYM